MIKKVAVVLTIILCATVLFGCGSAKSEVNVDVSSIYNEILARTETPEMIVLTEKRMMNSYGIDSSSCKQAIVAVCSDSLRTDEIWLIEADTIETAGKYLATAKACIEQKCAANENYLPEQYAVAQKGKTANYGRFVALFVSPEAERMLEIFNSACGK